MTIETNRSAGDLREALVSRILDRLTTSNPCVLLLSGGSAAPIGAAICRDLETALKESAAQQKPMAECRVSLVDERFGPAGHPDSNWNSLEPDVPLWQYLKPVPLLTGTSGSEEDFTIAVESFNRFLAGVARQQMRGDLFVAALFGIGEDGHTAGILPESPAAVIAPESGRFASGYKSIPHTRITIAPPFFLHIDLATVWAAGSGKKKVLASLQQALSPAVQPAQFLKLATETVIFTDQEVPAHEKA